jgi:hypothetical protein
MNKYIFVSATGAYVFYTHQHKSALPQKVTSTLDTELPLIGGRNLKHIMGLLRMYIMQVSCINSKLSFLIFLYKLQNVNVYWLVEKSSAPCIQYIPKSPKVVRRILLTDILHTLTSAIYRLHIFRFSCNN